MSRHPSIPRLIESGVTVFAVGLTMAGVLCAQPVPSAEPHFALVIGNNNYSHANKLKNAVNDAKDLGGELRKLGFQVEVVTDADKRTMEAAISRFVSHLGRDSVGLFHFSGHGLQVDLENYLIPVDFQITDEASVKYDAYPASKLHDRMAFSGGRLNIILLDACRNNGFSTSRSGASGLAAMNAARGSFIAFATAPGRIASDNPRGSNGLFTSYLIEALQVPGLKLDEVFNRVRENVFLASNKEQLAWTSSSVIGDFFFVPGSKSDRDLVWVKNDDQTLHNTTGGSQGPKSQSAQSRRIVINRLRLTDEEVASLEQTYRTRMLDGAYWYDRLTGAWGMDGGPTVGFVLAGINMGGPLHADASNGNTGVFINGRELHAEDVRGLQRLGPVFPGRYWVDANGWCGFEGGPAFVNLVALARQGQVITGRTGGTLAFDENGQGMFFGKDAVGNHITWP